MDWSAWGHDLVTLVVSVASTLGLLFFGGYLTKKGELTAEQEEAKLMAIVDRVREAAKAEGKAAGEAAGQAAAIEQIALVKKQIALAEAQAKSRTPAMEWARQQPIDSFNRMHAHLTEVARGLDDFDTAFRLQFDSRNPNGRQEASARNLALMTKVNQTTDLWNLARADVSGHPGFNDLEAALNLLMPQGAALLCLGSILVEATPKDKEARDKLSDFLIAFKPKLRDANDCLVSARKKFLAHQRGDAP